MDAIPWPWIFGFITSCAAVSWGAAVATFRLVRWIDEHDTD